MCQLQSFLLSAEIFLYLFVSLLVSSVHSLCTAYCYFLIFFVKSQFNINLYNYNSVTYFIREMAVKTKCVCVCMLLVRPSFKLCKADDVIASLDVSTQKYVGANTKVHQKYLSMY